MISWLLIGAAAGWVLFAYAGYPMTLALLARFAPRRSASAELAPPLSVIIAVHNGEARLERKLEETLKLEYPEELEILVASDGSTDRSDEIAASFAERGVRLVRNSERRGKEAAQATAIAEARGQILVFTDVGAELDAEALRNIARPFGDPMVGCVSSEDAVDSDEGEGAYVRFEMALRRLETRASTLVGLSGSFFAVRKELAEPWPPDLASDFRSALEAARRGYRSVSEPTALAHFGVAGDASAEWSRKVRTVRRGLAVLSAYRELLHPRHGRVALSLWGHKVARFTSPFALLLLLAASALAATQGPLGVALLSAQGLAYGLGGASLLGGVASRMALPRLAGFFLLVNASMLVAWFHHWRGERAVTWEPTRR